MACHATRRVLDLSTSLFGEILEKTSDNLPVPLHGLSAELRAVVTGTLTAAVDAETARIAAAEGSATSTSTSAAAAAGGGGAADGDSDEETAPGQVSSARNGSLIVRLDDAMLAAAASADGAHPATAALSNAALRAHFIARTAFTVWVSKGSVLVHVRKGAALALRQTLHERALGPAVDLARPSQGGGRDDRDD
ncbi:hypothetical protein FNF28_01786 [Cafeteria roenbergensis]|uniref:Uncharacterized protein n=1 Tax=Cafeteria roenbergensis TaxID=33653 RepID=A0A5A8DX30_CAFRO|nr:hypothetical protein FNF28_01786 [Cafeteria roenbergensis]